MNQAWLLLVAWAIAALLNVIPYFMPPTWTVVAYFLISFQLPLWPLSVGCAFGATAGRCCLYVISAKWGRRLLSTERRQSVTALGEWLNQRAGWQGVLSVVVCSLGPIPSNQLFIAAGLSRARLWPLVLGFLPGRVVSYTSLALAARAANEHVGGLWTRQWHDPKWLAVELLSIVSVVLFTRIDWPRVLHMSVPSTTAATTSQSAPAS